VSGTELMIIAILRAMGGSYLWRDSKMEQAAARTASTGTANSAQISTTAAPAPPAASIAVLAFSDLSPEGNQA